MDDHLPPMRPIKWPEPQSDPIELWVIFLVALIALVVTVIAELHWWLS